MEEQFFDKISGFYDNMIGFQAALERRAVMLKKFVNPEMEYAADIGCGTGLDSVSLAMAGLKVRSFDPSAGMIQEAEKNAADYSKKIKFYNSGFSGIPEIFDNSFDLAVSLGNTLANIPENELSASFGRLYDILKPGARVIVQILNYSRLKRLNERIVNITRHENHYFIRFYDFLDSNLNFNILKFNSSNPKERELSTNPLFPHSPEVIRKMFETHNFREIIFYGSLNQDEFNSETSVDLVVSAFK